MKRIALLAGCLLFVSCGGGGGEPSVPYLTLTKRDGSTGECTGTYISQTAILTAAHCLEGGGNSIVATSLGYTRDARAYYIHPQYNGRARVGFEGTEGGSDLAIVLVSEPIQAAPVPLLVSAGPLDLPPEVREESVEFDTQELVAYGYGIDGNGRGILERIANGEAPLKATFLSFTASMGGFLGSISYDFYETASTEEGTTCVGDSGGPILAKNANGEYGIIAVTSFSESVSETVRCVPIAKGTRTIVSPTQINSAMNFILTYAPDAAVN